MNSTHSRRLVCVERRERNTSKDLLLAARRSWVAHGHYQKVCRKPVTKGSLLINRQHPQSGPRMNTIHKNEDQNMFRWDFIVKEIPQRRFISNVTSSVCLLDCNHRHLCCFNVGMFRMCVDTGITEFPQVSPAGKETRGTDWKSTNSLNDLFESKKETVGSMMNVTQNCSSGSSSRTRRENTDLFLKWGQSLNGAYHEKPNAADWLKGCDLILALHLNFTSFPPTTTVTMRWDLINCRSIWPPPLNRANTLISGPPLRKAAVSQNTANLRRTGEQYHCVHSLRTQ